MLLLYHTFLSTEDIGKVSSSCSIRFGSLTYVSFSLRADGPCSSTTAFSIRNSLVPRGRETATRIQPHRDGQTHIQRDKRGIERATKTGRQTGRQADRHKRESGRQTDRQTGRNKRDGVNNSQRPTEQAAKGKCAAYTLPLGTACDTRRSPLMFQATYYTAWYSLQTAALFNVPRLSFVPTVYRRGGHQVLKSPRRWNYYDKNAPQTHP